jgi:multisubunit Na+/H+ antiporter MnhB subunit
MGIFLLIALVVVYLYLSYRSRAYLQHPPRYVFFTLLSLVLLLVIARLAEPHWKSIPGYAGESAYPLELLVILALAGAYLSRIHTFRW